MRSLFASLISGFWMLYHYTIGRVIFEMQCILIERKNKRAWDAYHRNTFYRKGW